MTNRKDWSVAGDGGGGVESRSCWILRNSLAAAVVVQLPELDRKFRRIDYYQPPGKLLLHSFRLLRNNPVGVGGCKLRRDNNGISPPHQTNL